MPVETVEKEMIPNKLEGISPYAVSADDCEDPLCNPRKPIKISFQDITSAAFMIRGGVYKTPCSVYKDPKCFNKLCFFLLYFI